MIRFLLLILLVGCGLSSPQPSSYLTHDEFKPYQAMFEANAKDHNQETYFIPINFKKETDSFQKGVTETVYKEKSNIIGVCKSVKYTSGVVRGLEILIDPIWWKSANEDKKRAVIDHELAHCVYNRSHNDEVVAGKPISVMNSFVLADYENFYNEYQIELHEGNKVEIKNSLEVNQ